MRRKRLKKCWKRMGELAVVEVEVFVEGQLDYKLDRHKLRQVWRHEGRYLLRTNMDANDPELLWHCYMQLVAVEESFRTLKGDLGLRPIYHQRPERIEAHRFTAFLAYCLTSSMRQQLRTLAGGLMPRAVFEKFSTMQMLHVCVPSTDGRELLLECRTKPDPDVPLLLSHLGPLLPPQPPPKIHSPKNSCCSGDV